MIYQKPLRVMFSNEIEKDDYASVYAYLSLCYPHYKVTDIDFDNSYAFLVKKANLVEGEGNLLGGLNDNG
jgi:uncharacterized Rossmann fold enzyme